MTEENQKAQLAEKYSQKQVEAIVAVARGVRKGLNIPERPRWRELIKNALGKRPMKGFAQQPETQGQPQSESIRVGIQERFKSRPRILKGFFGEEEKPKLNPEDEILMSEQKAQLLEAAARRSEAEKKAKADEESRLALERARENLSIGNV